MHVRHPPLTIDYGVDGKAHFTDDEGCSIGSRKTDFVTRKADEDQQRMNWKLPAAPTA